MSDVANINKSGWCAFCCSNFCYCSKESLMRQLRHTLDTIKERNETLDKEREISAKLKAHAEKLAEACEAVGRWAKAGHMLAGPLKEADDCAAGYRKEFPK